MCSMSKAALSSMERTKKHNSKWMTISADKLPTPNKKLPTKSACFRKMKRTSYDIDSNNLQNETWQYMPSFRHKNIFIQMLKGSQQQVTFIKDNQRLDEFTMQQLVDDVQKIRKNM